MMTLSGARQGGLRAAEALALALSRRRLAAGIAPHVRGWHARPEPSGDDAEGTRRLREMLDAGRADVALGEAGDGVGVARPSTRIGPAILTDTFGRRHDYLRISLTERCNLRCVYCMPEEGVPLSPTSHMMTREEIARLAGLFVRAGVTKVRLTGGEPTIRRDLVDIVSDLAALRAPNSDGCGGRALRSVALTSNGVTLHRTLPALKAAGLTHVNLSLDTLLPHRFEAMTRRPAKAMRHVFKSLRLAMALGFSPVKLNAVVMRPHAHGDSGEGGSKGGGEGLAPAEGGNWDEVVRFAKLTRRLPLNVRFIEWMPFDGNVWHADVMEPWRETKGRIERALGPLVPWQADPALRGREAGGGGGGPSHPEDLRPPSKEEGGIDAGATKRAVSSEVAKDFCVPGWEGGVSFVTSMTEHFCGTCSRLRLTSDGKLKTCLFGSREDEADLLGPMRDGWSDEELAFLIQRAVWGKKAKHAGMFELGRRARNKGYGRAMVSIGG